jgi:hypothetical protein
VSSEAGGLLEDIRIYNNIVYDNQWMGFLISVCCSEQHQMRDISVTNNSFYSNGRSGWGGGIMIENPAITDITVRNNISSQNVSFQIAVAANVPLAQITVDHNLIDGFRGYPGETYGTEYVTGNPRFMNPPLADFHLTGDSPAIDHGSSTGSPGTDVDFEARPQDGDGNGTAAFDIGADEVIP